MSSILQDIKHLLGIPAEETAFDTDVIIHINSALATLNQIGVGPNTGYAITGEDEEWEDFTDLSTINSVKSYIYFEVRLMFDPPKTGFELGSIERQRTELQFRLQVACGY